MKLKNRPSWWRDPEASAYSTEYMNMLVSRYHILQDTSCVLMIRDNIHIAEQQLAEIDAVEDCNFHRYHAQIMDGITEETFESLQKRLPEQWKKFILSLSLEDRITMHGDQMRLQQQTERKLKTLSRMLK